MAAPIINFSGIASGIDSSSLIKALLDRDRAVRVTPLEDKIAELTGVNSAFSDLSDLLAKLKTAAEKFREVYGGMLAKTGTSSDETVATVTAGNSALEGAYTLTVSSLAKNGTFSFRSTDGAYTGSNDKISSGAAFTDSVVVKIGDPAAPVDTVTVEVDENSTLSDFVTSFNSQTSRAVASIVNVGTSSDPDYRISINTNKTGLAEGGIDVTVGATLAARGGFDSNLKDDARNAVFSISGIGTNIERATNSFSDVVPGLTFNLKGVGNAALQLQSDADATTQSMQDFVDAYNDVIEYINENDTVSREQDGDDVKNVFGPLAHSALDENVVIALRTAFSSSSISGGSVNTLADMGISTERDGTLKFDTEAFHSALSSDPQSVRSITGKLGDTLASTDGTIAQFVRFNGLFDQSENANTQAIREYQKRVGELEKVLGQQEETLTSRFSRLEALIGQLNSQQSALSSLLPR